MPKPTDPTPKPDKAVHTKPHEKPLKVDKKKITDRLKAKGVDQATASHLSGEDDDNLTAREIAQRRIEWQRTLRKA